MKKCKSPAVAYFGPSRFSGARIPKSVCEMDLSGRILTHQRLGSSTQKDHSKSLNNI